MHTRMIQMLDLLRETVRLAMYVGAERRPGHVASASPRARDAGSRKDIRRAPPRARWPGPSGDAHALRRSLAARRAAPVGGPGGAHAGRGRRRSREAAVAEEPPAAAEGGRTKSSWRTRRHASTASCLPEPTVGGQQAATTGCLRCRAAVACTSRRTTVAATWAITRRPARTRCAASTTAACAGAEYLVLPATALWWLDHYGELGERLGTGPVEVLDDPDLGLVFELAERPSPTSSGAWSLPARSSPGSRSWPDLAGLGIAPSDALRHRLSRGPGACSTSSGCARPASAILVVPHDAFGWLDRAPGWRAS